MSILGKFRRDDGNPKTMLHTRFWEYWHKNDSIFGWRIFPARGPPSNIIDVEVKVKQKENNEIDNVLKSEKKIGI